MDDPESLATVIRVTRPDTLLIRMMVPQVQSMIATHLLLEGVDVCPEAQGAIKDWLALHADGERCRLISGGRFFRDTFGRLLGDLADIRTGEVLTDYLIDTGVAEARPNHFMDLVTEMLIPEGPEA